MSDASAGVEAWGGRGQGRVLREAGRLLAIGAVAGTLPALAATRSAASLLFGLHANDPLTFATAALALALTTGAAGLLPALRAARAIRWWRCGRSRSREVD